VSPAFLCPLPPITWDADVRVQGSGFSFVPCALRLEPCTFQFNGTQIWGFKVHGSGFADQGPAISYQLSAISYELSALSYELSAISVQPPALSFQPMLPALLCPIPVSPYRHVSASFPSGSMLHALCYSPRTTDNGPLTAVVASDLKRSDPLSSDEAKPYALRPSFPWTTDNCPLTAVVASNRPLSSNEA
jgi:hypothetical protein